MKSIKIGLYLISVLLLSKTTFANSLNDALVKAASECDLKLVETLVVKAGANPQEKGQSIFFAKSGNVFVAPIHEAAGKGCYDVVKFLLSEGVPVDHRYDPSTTSWGNYTPLFLAASYGQYEVAKLLLDNGADYKIKVEHPNANVDSPLSYAEYKQHNDIVELMLNY